MRTQLDEIIKKYSVPNIAKSIDTALKKIDLLLIKEYEEEVEIWKTYGGD